MATAIKKCRVCGKLYEACRTMRQNPMGIFRWQEVACSPECGSIYLARIEESRRGHRKDEEMIITPENTNNSKWMDSDFDKIDSIDSDVEIDLYEEELNDYFDDGCDYNDD